MKEDIRTGSARRNIGLSTVAALSCEQSRSHHKRCAQCGKPFGLIRHRRAGKQFCSQNCMNRRAEAVQKLVHASSKQPEFSEGSAE